MLSYNSNKRYSIKKSTNNESKGDWYTVTIYKDPPPVKTSTTNTQTYTSTKNTGVGSNQPFTESMETGTDPIKFPIGNTSTQTNNLSGMNSNEGIFADYIQRIIQSFIDYSNQQISSSENVPYNIETNIFDKIKELYNSVDGYTDISNIKDISNLIINQFLSVNIRYNKLLYDKLVQHYINKHKPNESEKFESVNNMIYYSLIYLLDYQKRTNFIGINDSELNITKMSAEPYNKIHMHDSHPGTLSKLFFKVPENGNEDSGVHRYINIKKVNSNLSQNLKTLIDELNMLDNKFTSSHGIIINNKEIDTLLTSVKILTYLRQLLYQLELVNGLIREEVNHLSAEKGRYEHSIDKNTNVLTFVSIRDNGGDILPINCNYRNMLFSNTSKYGVGFNILHDLRHKQLYRLTKNKGESKSDVYNIESIEEPVYNFYGNYGPFNSISYNQNNKDFANNMKGISDMIMEGKDVFVIGYGMSGAGKTSTLIYNNFSKEIGSIMYLLNLMATQNSGGIGKAEIHINQMYANSSNSNDPYNKSMFSKPEFVSVEYNPSIKTWIISNNSNAKLIKLIGEKEEEGNEESNEEEKKEPTRLDSLLEQAINNSDYRYVAGTTNNPQSSRSHVLITIIFDGNYGKLFIGDFAGVENANSFAIYKPGDKIYEEINNIISSGEFNINVYYDMEDKKKLGPNNIVSDIIKQLVVEKSIDETIHKYDTLILPPDGGLLYPHQNDYQINFDKNNLRQMLEYVQSIYSMDEREQKLLELDGKNGGMDVDEISNYKKSVDHLLRNCIIVDKGDNVVTISKSKKETYYKFLFHILMLNVYKYTFEFDVKIMTDIRTGIQDVKNILGKLLNGSDNMYDFLSNKILDFMFYNSEGRKDTVKYIVLGSKYINNVVESYDYSNTFSKAGSSYKIENFYSKLREIYENNIIRNDANININNLKGSTLDENNIIKLSNKGQTNIYSYNTYHDILNHNSEFSLLFYFHFINIISSDNVPLLKDITFNPKGIERDLSIDKHSFYNKLFLDFPVSYEGKFFIEKPFNKGFKSPKLPLFTEKPNNKFNHRTIKDFYSINNKNKIEMVTDLFATFKHINNSRNQNNKFILTVINRIQYLQTEIIKRTYEGIFINSSLSDMRQDISNELYNAKKSKAMSNKKSNYVDVIVPDSSIESVCHGKLVCDKVIGKCFVRDNFNNSSDKGIIQETIDKHIDIHHSVSLNNNSGEDEKEEEKVIDTNKSLCYCTTLVINNRLDANYPTPNIPYISLYNLKREYRRLLNANELKNKHLIYETNYSDIIKENIKDDIKTETGYKYEEYISTKPNLKYITSVHELVKRLYTDVTTSTGKNKLNGIYTRITDEMSKSKNYNSFESGEESKAEAGEDNKFVSKLYGAYNIQQLLEDIGTYIQTIENYNSLTLIGTLEFADEMMNYNLIYDKCNITNNNPMINSDGNQLFNNFGQGDNSIKKMYFKYGEDSKYKEITGITDADSINDIIRKISSNSNSMSGSGKRKCNKNRTRKLYSKPKKGKQKLKRTYKNKLKEVKLGKGKGKGKEKIKTKTKGKSKTYKKLRDNQIKKGKQKLNKTYKTKTS